MHEMSGLIHAVKRIEIIDYTNAQVKEIMKEVDLLKSLRHENIIEFKDYLVDDGFVNIILEYVDLGRN